MMRSVVLVPAFVLWTTCQVINGFQPAAPVGTKSSFHAFQSKPSRYHAVPLFVVDPKLNELSSPLEDANKSEAEETAEEGAAATNTINERLMAELKEVTEQETGGPRSAMGKKLGLEGFRSEKTDEERQAAIEEARNLNGVNPVVCLAGGAFALVAAAAIWTFTNFLATYFALHPVESDIYFVGRAAAVFRNIVMGMSSLASGFFGVTGLGIFLLGVRVAYGVATGELDPTPIKKSRHEDLVELPNVWDLMMNKKPGRGNK